ncbi:MAG TPA: helix-turn-helix domain-containing protein [Candidatus Thermoplasmatota archaeon]
MPRADRWTLLVLSGPGMPAKVARWLEPFGPTEINIAPGIAPRLLRAKFDVLPPIWQAMLSNVTVHYVDLTPEGSASIFVGDSLDKVERFVKILRVESPGVRARQSLPGPARVKLTSRQLEVLALAVALGYYETPHKISLRAMAKKLGLSVGATSELLRRGESLIVTNYVDALTASDWKQLEESR